jgi:hypothetical protein
MSGKIIAGAVLGTALTLTGCAADKFAVHEPAPVVIQQEESISEQPALPSLFCLMQDEDEYVPPIKPHKREITPAPFEEEPEPSRSSYVPSRTASNRIGRSGTNVKGAVQLEPSGTTGEQGGLGGRVVFEPRVPDVCNLSIDAKKTSRHFDDDFNGGRSYKENIAQGRFYGSYHIDDVKLFRGEPDIGLRGSTYSLEEVLDYNFTISGVDYESNEIFSSLGAHFRDGLLKLELGGINRKVSTRNFDGTNYTTTKVSEAGWYGRGLVHLDANFDLGLFGSAINGSTNDESYHDTRVGLEAELPIHKLDAPIDANAYIFFDEKNFTKSERNAGLGTYLILTTEQGIHAFHAVGIDDFFQAGYIASGEIPSKYITGSKRKSLKSKIESYLQTLKNFRNYRIDLNSDQKKDAQRDKFYDIVFACGYPLAELTFTSDKVETSTGRVRLNDAELKVAFPITENLLLGVNGGICYGDNEGLGIAHKRRHFSGSLYWRVSDSIRLGIDYTHHYRNKLDPSDHVISAYFKFWW